MSRLSALAQATLRGATAGVLSWIGLLLPIDFLNYLDSLLKYVRPVELISAYSVAWLSYAVVGGLAGGLIGFVVSAVLILARRPTDRIIRFLTLWIVAVVLAEGLVRGFRSYIEGAPVDRLRSWMGPGFAIANVIVILALSIWLAARHGEFLLGLRSFLKAVAVFGALAGVVSILLALSHSAPARNDSTASVAREGPRPLIVLITIDTLTANHMSLYGYPRVTTPCLDRLGKESIVFDNHHSNANVTTPAIGAILTGSRPWTHRAFRLLARPLPQVAQHGLLPALQHAGYETLVVTTNFWASPFHQRCAAWMTHWAHGTSDAGNWILFHAPWLGPVWYLPTLQRMLVVTLHAFALRDRGNREWDPDGAFSRARGLLSGTRSGKPPKLLWVHVFPPHDPYAAPAPFLRTFEPAQKALKPANSSPPFAFLPPHFEFPGVFGGRYDEAVLYEDHYVGKFLDWLRQQGFFEDALILVTADHGESFSHRYGTHAGPMLHEDLIHVPLLIKPPHLQQGRRISLLTEHVDLLPTILDYLGEPVPEYVEGRSLKPLLGGGDLDRRSAYAMDFEQNSTYRPLKTGTIAMLDGRYKYVKYMGEIRYPFMPKLEDALYDLDTDPGETRNLIAESPERAAQMLSAIDSQIAAHSLPAW